MTTASSDSSLSTPWREAEVAGIGERIKELRRSGESVAGFARLVGVPEANIRTYLYNGMCPRADKLVRIAAACGVSVDWLATGRGERTPSKLIDHVRTFTQEVSDAVKTLDGALTKLYNAALQMKDVSAAEINAMEEAWQAAAAQVMAAAGTVTALDKVTRARLQALQNIKKYVNA